MRPETEFLRVGDRERALGSRACLCCSPWTFGLFEKRQRFVQAWAQHSIWTTGVLGGGSVPRTPRKGTPMTPMTSPTRRRKCLRVSKQPPLVKRVWVARLFNALCYAFACGFPLGSLLGTLCPRIEETQNFGNKLCPLVCLLSSPCSLPSLARVSQIAWALELLPDRSLS